MRETREGWERGGTMEKRDHLQLPPSSGIRLSNPPQIFPSVTRPNQWQQIHIGATPHICHPSISSPHLLLSFPASLSPPLPHAVTCWFLTQSIDYNSTYRLCYWTLSIAHHHNILINLHSLLRVITSLCGKEPVPWCNNDVNLDLSGPWELNGGKFSLLFSLFLFFFYLHINKSVSIFLYREETRNKG